MPGEIGDRKRELRVAMRRTRALVDERDERTVRLWSYVRNEPAVRAARVLMAYDAVAGEPDTAAFLAWCRSVGKSVVVPASDVAARPPVAPGVPDVVIVPGLAFTPNGARLGQGGGWYDRFLPDVRPDCTVIGVAFSTQLLDELPEERHDIRVHVVVTDEGRSSSR
jgi:5-formyltetrahydrofolate cyclo-ligase